MPKKKDTVTMQFTGEIIPQPMEDVMHSSMMTYAEHVLLERAIPRVEDGLKPVQRRILYTMYELGMTPDKPHRKSARVVGDCLGKYHPHGDSSVYDAMVRMAQDFVMRTPLVDGHGNFGSVDGDGAAAMRYTEARMDPRALLLLQDIEKDTVPFSLNFDDTMKEPDLLPGRFPNLLVNGASGIAVGLATNIPPHNPEEVIDGVIQVIDDPDITIPQLMKTIKGPDFPTGGLIIGRDELIRAYETGRGKLTVRARVETEKGPAGKTLLVIKEIPYQVNKAQMLEKILKLSEEKKGILTGISDIRDETDRTGMRAVIELKKDADAEKILNYLYKYVDLQVTFGVNMVAIVGGKPQLLDLKQVLTYYIGHQKDVVTRRTRFDLEAAKRRAHILEGLIIAIDNIDEVVRIIRSSRSTKMARERLMERFDLTEIQAQAILDMRLARLTALEVESLRKELKEVLALINRLEKILKSEKRLMEVIKEELLAVRQQMLSQRRTEIVADGSTHIDEGQFVVVEDVAVTLTAGGVMRRVPAKQTRAVGSELEEDPVRFCLDTRTDKRLLMITDKGFSYLMDVTAVPECRWRDKGAKLTSFVNGYDEEETPIALFALSEGEKGVLLTVTAGGMVKKSDISEYNGRRGRFAAMNLKGDDVIVTARLAQPQQTVLLVTCKGMSIHFSHKGISTTGRATAGVKGIALDKDDRVLWAGLVEAGEGELILASNRGYVKRSLIADYDLQGRGGKGLKTFDFKKNGANGTRLTVAETVTEPYALFLRTKDGIYTRVETEDIPIEARFSKGTPMVMALLTNTLEGAERIR